MLREMILSVRRDARLEVCKDGPQALDALATKADLILAGRELPGIDGLDLLRSVRATPGGPGLPFILMSERSDLASVREALPHSPTAYLSKPLHLDGLRRRLEQLLLGRAEQASGPLPAVQPRLSLEAFLQQRRTNAGGGAMFADVQEGLQLATNAETMGLRALEERLGKDPQMTGVLIAAANSAAMHRDVPVQSLSQALHRLGGIQSMNLLLGLALNRSARLSDPLLVRPAEHFLGLSLRVAEFAKALACLLKLDQQRCYCAGLLHRLGDLALLRCLQEWRMAGGELDEDRVQSSLDEHGAPFGSALRARWRLPLQLRELIAAIYQLSGGVYSQYMLVMNLAGQLARALPNQDNAEIASSLAARLLKLDVPELDLLRAPALSQTEATTGRDAG
ncbi:HD-like signal output (HDOD) domain, no enzymatic activity [Pseudomonas sp. URIL14HWK12:I9]|nr:HD-like signal output (HDOD) protein [Pseudomonas sp. URIL14HWK12:I12]PVZ23223.1 HD-like signal output (HDOD) protein [Pseudomonas sp. URIL14HWK12:I10]PVZ32552.1 HD-like signal output (HDOD) protein [Pseudomonas sp. URIL14HWK12:I11]SNZ13652.1 HD-like signal output (HDOD) domain, no enzymatic activity [Pseudomonas sp. URIL14HWK12:I9]